MNPPPLRSQAQYDYMKAREEKTYCAENVIHKDAAKFIYEYWQQERGDREFLAGRGYSDEDEREENTKGSLKFPYAWSELSKVIGPIAERIIGTKRFRFISGRMYLVSPNYTWDNIHTDTWNYLKKIYPDGCPDNNGPDFVKWAIKHPDRIYMSWKTIVIPVHIKGSANTVVFNQYNYSPESVSWNKHLKRTEWPGSVASFTEGITDEMSITDEQYNKYLSHMKFPRENLKGLSIQAVHDWKVGNAYVWDSTQLHVAGYHEPDTEKVAVTIWTAQPKEIQDALSL